MESSHNDIRLTIFGNRTLAIAKKNKRRDKQNLKFFFDVGNSSVGVND